MTEPSPQAPGHVDLSTLTSGLHVLDVAPAWAAVERALARLDSARTRGTNLEDPTVKEDLQTVHEFHQLLERGAETLALALLCGAVLGQASAAESFGEKLLFGLRAISHGYGFDRLAEEDRKKRLEKLRKELGDHGLIHRSIYGIWREVKGFDRSGWEKWCELLRSKVEQSVAADRFTTELPTFRERAWSVWRDRLAPQPRFERASWPRVEPVLAHLVCAAAGVSPANRLDLDLGRMGLVAWSEAVFHALSGRPLREPQACPAWLVAPALYRLGFRPVGSPGSLTSLVEKASILVGLASVVLPDDLLAWIGQWERFFERGHKDERLSILIVRRAEGSAATAWKVARRGSVLALTEAQLTSLDESVGPTLRPMLSSEVRLIVVEVPRDHPFAASTPPWDFRSPLFPPDLPTAILVAQDSPTRIPDGVRTIKGAKNTDDLIERARPFLPRSAR